MPGSAVIVIGTDANALATPPLGEALSHVRPETVAVVALKFSAPPPAFETVSVCDRAAAPCTKEKIKELGFTLRLGAPGAVVVRATLTVSVPGCAFAAVI